MPQTNISGANYSNMSGVVQDRTVETKTPDSAGDTDETVWENTKFSQYYGYYKKIPELKTAIDMRAVWTIGKGYETDDAETQVILDHISGFGCDTFNSVLKNLMIMKRVAGDSFAEVMRDEDSGLIVNIKPLNPGSIRIVTDRWGIIKRYEQYDGNSKAKTAWAKFNPEEILHLTNKRVADEIHGVSDIEAVEEIIKANNESFFDMKELQHRFVRPKFIFEVDTDDTTKIAAFTAKMDA